MAEHCQKVMYFHCLTHTWWHLITAAWPTGFNHANILHGISLWMAEILDRFMTDDSMLTMFSILHMFVKSRFWNSSPNILVFPFLSLFIYHFISFLLVVLHSTSYLVFLLFTNYPLLQTCWYNLLRVTWSPKKLYCLHWQIWKEFTIATKI